jgi:SAM-dependent methyltransferase
MESEEYDAMAAVESQMWWYRGLHGWLLDRIRDLPVGSGGFKLLDCGAGTGGFAQKIGKEVPAVSLFAVDIDAGAVRHFAKKSPRPIVRGSVNGLPFAPDTFDAIVAADVLYHAAVDENRALGELRRCLRKGGTLMLNLPAYNWMRSSHDDRVHTARRYTTGAASEKVRAAGFEIVQATYRNALLFPIMALFRLTVGRLATKSDVADVPPWQNVLFGAAISFENAMARRGVRFPFGGSVYVQAVKK